MKKILILITLTLLSTSYGEDETPQWAAINLKLLNDFDREAAIQTVNDWPEKFTVPLKKTGKIVVNNLKDHHALVDSIPKKFMENYKTGSTLERDGWYITSLDFKTDKGESTWMTVVATKKGGSDVYTMTQW